MHTEAIQPYGEWRSPISAALIATGSRPLARPRMHGGDLYWLEGRAAEGGRMTLMRARPGQAPVECTPAPFNVRTRVHEYGGGAYLPFDGGVVFSHFADNRLYLLQDDAATPLTAGDKLRHADFTYDAARGRMICVREDHTHSDLQPVNTICAVALDGGAQTVLVEGADFHASCRPSGDRRGAA